METLPSADVIDDPAYNILEIINNIEETKTKIYKYASIHAVNCIAMYRSPVTNQYKVIVKTGGWYVSHSYICYFADKELNILHRDNYPALIEICNNYVHRISYYENNIAHRINGPQECTFNFYKNIVMQKYQTNNEKHRDDGPAITTYYEDDNYTFSSQKLNKRAEYYYQHNKLNRLDGPAYILYHLNQTKLEECWYRNNLYHRLDGPAYIHYNEGKATRNIYYINEKKLDKTKLPYFKDNMLVGPIQLNKNSILRGTLFDREYGAFLKEKYDKMSSCK